MSLTNIEENEKQATEFLAAIATKFTEHREHLRCLLVKLKIYNAADSDDILQDVILKVYDKIRRKGLTEGSFYNAYLTTCLNRAVPEYNKKRGKIKWVTGFLLSIDYILENEEEDNEPVALLDSALIIPAEESDDFSEASVTQYYEAVKVTFDSLPEKYRELLLMDASGLKYKDMCRVLNLTMGQVKMRIKSARDIIKAKHNIYPEPEELC